MTIAVINFSGNVGKTTVARHLLAPPRIPGRQVESINADDGQSVTIRGRQFAQLQEFLQSVDNVVIDIGASNVEELLKLMRRYRDRQEDFDGFIVPPCQRASSSRTRRRHWQSWRASGFRRRGCAWSSTRSTTTTRSTAHSFTFDHQRCIRNDGVLPHLLSTPNLVACRQPVRRKRRPTAAVNNSAAANPSSST